MLDFVKRWPAKVRCRGRFGENDKHYSYGFTTRLKELYETAFPEIADKIERSKTKLVLLTAGCPETCHRTGEAEMTSHRSSRRSRIS